ncbi:MAG: six-cysteine ranthipeptide SCIFF [Saccharofermentanales bacterium]
MSRITTIAKAGVKKPENRKACGECQTSCQSACKTSCTVANQKCENTTK